MQIKHSLKLLMLVCFLTPATVLSRTINLACNLPSGEEWGTLKIDLKQKTIIDTNILQKASADYLERWKEKYYRERGQDYKTKAYDADKSATKFIITKVTDGAIFGENHSLGNYQSIEVNRYTLVMRYPEMPTNDVFKCAKVEKAF